LKGVVSNQKWFEAISKFTCMQPKSSLSDNLFHLKCAKAWLYYSLEPTLATTFSGSVAGDGGQSDLPWDTTKSSDLSLDGEQGICIQLAVVIHLATPWFRDST
jgi:hypothetical protein